MILVEVYKFYSERSSSKQNICGTVFAFNDQDIRIWAMAGESVFFYVCFIFTFKKEETIMPILFVKCTEQ